MPSRDFEVRIKPMVDPSSVKKAHDDVQKGVGDKPIDLTFDTKNIGKQLKEISGAVKGIQGVLNSGFSVKGTEDVNKAFDKMSRTLDSLDSKFEELFKDGKQVGSVVDIGDLKLAEGQLTSLEGSLKEIQTTLSSIKNTKNSVGIQNEIQDTKNQIDRACDSLDAFWSKMKGSTKVNLTSDSNFTKQLNMFMSDVKNGFKGGLDEFGLDKLTKIKGEYNTLFKNIMGYVSGGGDLSKGITTIEGELITVRDVLREINNVYQGTDISKRMMVGARNGFDLRVFDALSEVTQADAKLQDLNKTLEITENKEASLFDKDTANRLANVIDKINELLTATGGIDKLAESFNELNSVLLKLSTILNTSGTDALAKAASTTSKKVKSFEDESRDLLNQIGKIGQEIAELQKRESALTARGLSTTNISGRIASMKAERQTMTDNLYGMYSANGRSTDEAEAALKTVERRIQMQNRLTEGVKEETNALKEAKKEQDAINKSIERNKQKQLKNTKKEILDLDKQILTVEKNIRDVQNSGGDTSYWRSEQKRLNAERTSRFDTLGSMLNTSEYNEFLRQRNAAKVNQKAAMASKEQSAVNKGQASLAKDLKTVQAALDEIKQNSAFVALNQDVEKTDASIKELSNDLSKVKTVSELDNLRNDFNSLEQSVENYKKQLKDFQKYNSQFDELSNRIQDTTAKKNFTPAFMSQAEDLSKQISDMQKAATSVEELGNAYKAAQDKVRTFEIEAEKLDNVLADQTSIEKLNLKIQKFVSENTRMGRKMSDSFSNLQVRLQGADVTQQELKSITSEFIRLEAEAYKLGKTGTSTFVNLKNRIKQMSTNFVAMYFSFYDIIRYVRQAVSAVTELDSAMTELRKVSDASQARIAQNFEVSAKAAQDLGSTIKEVINITADWSRLNISGLIYSNV